LQPAHAISGGELTALVGVEDLRPAAASQRHLQSIETELRVKAVGELSAVAEGFSEGVDVPGEQIHNRHQVEEPSLQRHVGDVGGQHLIHSRDHPEVHQAVESL